MEIENISMVNSLFQQPWWLEAVAPGVWKEALVTRGNEVVARMPYVLTRRYGMSIISMPPLTHTLGPWFRASATKYSTKLSEQKIFMLDIIEQLPQVDYVCFFFSPEITNWLPFYWAGFQQTTLYTYRLEDLSDSNRIWKGFRENIRREIRKAEKQVVVRDDLGLEQFYSINRMTFDRQGKKIPYSFGFLERLDKACIKYNARKILFAEDEKGQIHAAIYIVWDDNVAYYLMGGGNPILRTSGATSLLIWEAIKFSASVSKAFDFEGSMIEPIERFFRAFGAIQTPYHKITKMNNKMRIASTIRDVSRRLFL